MQVPIRIEKKEAGHAIGAGSAVFHAYDDYVAASARDPRVKPRDPSVKSLPAGKVNA